MPRGFAKHQPWRAFICMYLSIFSLFGFFHGDADAFQSTQLVFLSTCAGQKKPIPPVQQPPTSEKQDVNEHHGRKSCSLTGRSSRSPRHPVASPLHLRMCRSGNYAFCGGWVTPLSVRTTRIISSRREYGEEWGIVAYFTGESPAPQGLWLLLVGVQPVQKRKLITPLLFM